MKDYEELLKQIVDAYNKDGKTSFPLYMMKSNERMLFKKLETDGLIDKVRYIGRDGIGFDVTYEGIHYFDDKEETFSTLSDVYFLVDGKKEDEVDFRRCMEEYSALGCQKIGELEDDGKIIFVFRKP